MKKRLKAVLLCSIICIIAGTVLTGASYQYAKSNYVLETETYAQNFDIDVIDNIVIQNTVASVHIERGERFGLIAENIPKDTLICEVSGNTLTISTESLSNSFNFNIGFIKFPNFPSMEGATFTDWMLAETKIYLYIPESKDIHFEEIIIKENVGNINADYLSCRILEIGANVGNTAIDEFYSEDMLYVNSGVGNVTLKNGLVNGDININERVGITTVNATVHGDVDINGGVGSINLKGSVNGNIKIDGGVGSTTLSLAGNPDDYNVYGKAGVGSVYFNGEKNSDTFGYADKSAANEKYDIRVDGGVGSINISIE